MHSNGSGLKLTISRYYTPSGRSIHESGVVPNHVHPQTNDDTRTISDTQLRRALMLLPGTGPWFANQQGPSAQSPSTLP